MQDSERAPDGAAGDPFASAEAPIPDDAAPNGAGFESLRDDIAVLVEDARTYAEAEMAFQKTRATIAGKVAGRAVVYAVLALLLLHLALIALAVGAVIALAPLVTIWGAIGIVVGVLLLGVLMLLLRARDNGLMLSGMFGGGEGR